MTKWLQDWIKENCRNCVFNIGFAMCNEGGVVTRQIDRAKAHKKDKHDKCLHADYEEID